MESKNRETKCAQHFSASMEGLSGQLRSILIDLAKLNNLPIWEPMLRIKSKRASLSGARTLKHHHGLSDDIVHSKVLEEEKKLLWHLADIEHRITAHGGDWLAAGVPGGNPFGNSLLTGFLWLPAGPFAPGIGKYFCHIQDPDIIAFLEHISQMVNFFSLYFTLVGVASVEICVFGGETPAERSPFGDVAFMLWILQAHWCFAALVVNMHVAVALNATPELMRRHIVMKKARTMSLAYSMGPGSFIILALALPLNIIDKSCEATYTSITVLHTERVVVTIIGFLLMVSTAFYLTKVNQYVARPWEHAYHLARDPINQEHMQADKDRVQRKIGKSIPPKGSIMKLTGFEEVQVLKPVAGQTAEQAPVLPMHTDWLHNLLFIEHEKNGDRLDRSHLAARLSAFGLDSWTMIDAACCQGGAVLVHGLLSDERLALQLCEQLSVATCILKLARLEEGKMDTGGSSVGNQLGADQNAQKSNCTHIPMSNIFR